MSEIKSHFDDCPYGCNDKGMLLDESTRTFVKCPHCWEKRKELMRGSVDDTGVENLDLAELRKKFGSEGLYLSGEFSYDAIVVEGERLLLDAESLEYQEAEIKELLNCLKRSELPRCSYCFGIESRGRVDRLAFPILADAYKNGLSVCRFISANEYGRIVNTLEDEIDEFYANDLVVMLLNEGITKSVISSVKGLMQIRGLAGKPTVFVTTMERSRVESILDCGEETYLLSKPVFLKKKSTVIKQQSSDSDSEKITLRDLMSC